MRFIVFTSVFLYVLCQSTYTIMSMNVKGDMEPVNRCKLKSVAILKESISSTQTGSMILSLRSDR